MLNLVSKTAHSTTATEPYLILLSALVKNEMNQKYSFLPNRGEKWNNDGKND